MSGNRFWIDVEQAKAVGVTFHTTDEIVADLDRIARKMPSAADVARGDRIRTLVRADAEQLVQGSIAASAVKGVPVMECSRRLSGVQIVGFVMTAADFDLAKAESLREGLVKPVA